MTNKDKVVVTATGPLYGKTGKVDDVVRSDGGNLVLLVRLDGEPKARHAFGRGGLAYACAEG